MKLANRSKQSGCVDSSQRGGRAVLSPDAREDIREILLWSRDSFGSYAAARYRALLIQALRDIEADPLRAGSRSRAELADGTRTYHLSFSRDQVQGPRVKTPRHLLLYRVGAAGIEVSRILHDSRDLLRNVPQF